MSLKQLDRWLIGAGALVAVFLLDGLLTWQNTYRLRDDAQWVSHTHQVLRAVEAFPNQAHLAESLQRTYLIVGQDSLLEEFTAAIERLRTGLDDLGELLQDDPEQARLPSVEQQTEALIARWSETIRVRQHDGFDAAQQIVAAGEARRMMSDLEQQLGQIRDAENTLLTDRRHRREQTYEHAVGSILLLTLAATSGVVALTVMLRRYEQARTSAALAIAAQGDRLRTTLASIGDAVITTDVEGKVTNLNAAAEELTGWTGADAFGRPLEEVFHIVNEDTRDPAENPVSRALAQRRVVGLANHTILIARDGTEYSIDDSAAPIRTTGGTIIGCVLVFRDVTERRREERLKTQHLHDAQVLSAIVEHSHDAIFSKSLSGVVRTWNAAAERLFGYSAEEMIGQSIMAIVPTERQGEEQQIIDKIRGGERLTHYDTERRHRDGHLISVSLTISPIWDESGQVVGASNITRDITHRKRGERLLNEQARLLELIATGRALPECLTRLTQSIVALEPLARAALVLADEAGEQIVRVISTGMPEAFDAQLQATPLRELIRGSGGTWPRDGQASQTVESATRSAGGSDAESDAENGGQWGSSPAWPDWMLSHGVAAYHAEPIYDPQRRVVALLLLLFSQPQQPSDWQRQTAEFGAHIASIAIERARVREELATSIDELGRFNRVMVSREGRMIDLKREVNELCLRQGERARYPLQFEHDAESRHETQ